MRVADTSALYALFSETDVHHAQARAALEDPEPIVIPGEIFSETVSLVQYRHGAAAAARAGNFLRTLPHVRIRTTPARTFQEAWTVFEDERGRLSLPDSVVVAWCEAEDAPVLAFDKAIERRVGAA